jgi:hypothetical protein
VVAADEGERRYRLRTVESLTSVAVADGIRDELDRALPLRPWSPRPRCPIDADDVARAAARLDGRRPPHPGADLPSLDAATGATIHLKAEHLQRVGAFKFRGAYNAVTALPSEVRARGVVAFSSGNHAQAIALAARSTTSRRPS